MGPSDDEAEEAPRPHGGEAGFAGFGQQVEDLRGPGPVVRKGPAECRRHLVDGGLRRHRPIFQGGQPVQRMPMSPVEGR
jgi:hypothetical protein